MNGCYTVFKLADGALADDLFDPAAAELPWGRGRSHLLLCCSWPPLAIYCSIPNNLVPENLHAGSLEISEMMAKILSDHQLFFCISS